MTSFRCSVLIGLVSCLLPWEIRAQSPSRDVSEALHRKLGVLRERLASLPDRRPARDVRRADIRIYAKAVEWILRHQEFYKPGYGKDALWVLETGLARADAWRQGRLGWGETAGRHLLGYVSRVDGSVQPYAVTLPDGFHPKRARRWPLHVVLHGRGGTLNEVRFIRQHSGKPPQEGQDWIQLDVFGRTNNAYRWSGETDVFEAMKDLQSRYRIDEKRITLWGFSMGGAGAWHLGLHHPSRWSSFGAGAGFVDFYKYQNVKTLLPDWQDKTLRIYDAVRYAENLSVVPGITYGGERDKQLAASLMMQQAAQLADVPLEVLIGPKMGHKFDPKSFRTFMAFHARHAEKGRAPFPGKREFRFVTYTLKYNQCEWLTIHELDEPYQKTEVKSAFGSDGVLELTTDNVHALSIARGTTDRVRIDGGEPVLLESSAGGFLPDVYFLRAGKNWVTLDYEESLEFQENPLRNKRHNLQGPIDDAFMEPFLCVRGTGEPWSDKQAAWSSGQLARFEREYDKWLRAKVPVVDDRDVTESMISDRHLILFGDPGSNSLIQRILPDLPVRWTAEHFEIGGKSYATDQAGFVMIFPNPLNPKRYVVLNTGHTMHEKDFRASNSWLFPKLGDVAVIRFDGRETSPDATVVWAAIFESDWTLPE